MPVDGACPVCQWSDGSVLHTFSAEEAAQQYVPVRTELRRREAVREHIQRLWGGPECRVIRCAQCGFCHAQPYVAGDATFYELVHAKTTYPDWKWEFELTRHVVAKMVKVERRGGFRLLEIGAGDGAFLRRITPALVKPDRVLATEYSAYGKREIEKLGVRCLAADIRQLCRQEYAGAFHAVCLFQVLEHLDELEALFAQLSAIAAANGSLFIAVPNELRIEFNESSGSLLDLPPNHIGRWTRRSFAVLAERLGWEMVDHRRQIESFRGKAVRHLKFCRTRRAQDETSLANFLERTCTGPLRKPGIALDIAVNGWRALPALVELARRKELGDSQWVHLRKV
jgi:SAM-dependent methyltransferase